MRAWAKRVAGIFCSTRPGSGRAVRAEICRVVTIMRCVWRPGVYRLMCIYYSFAREKIRPHDGQISKKAFDIDHKGDLELKPDAR
jgi:predicted LPLAT superfamily acyltransferase